jgi:sialidase-1
MPLVPHDHGLPIFLPLPENHRMTPPLSRRRFTGLSLAATAALYGPRPAKAAGIELIGTKTISPQAHYYHGWPTLTRTEKGELIVVWSGRREGHVCPFGTVEMMQSRDNGATWTFPRTIHDGPIDDRDAGILETARGTLIVTTFTSLAYAPMVAAGGSKANDPAWLALHARITDDETRDGELGTWCFRSHDGGLSFSGRIDTIVNSPHGPCQLADGRLLYLGKELWTDEKRIGAAESKDDGETWQWLSEIPTREGDLAADYHELHAIQCASGKIVAQIRNHNAANKDETLQTESTDGGKTWTVPHSIGVWGLPSHLLRLRGDRLLMTYGYRRKPFGNQARISGDEGATWSEPFAISEDGIGGDLGYPSTVELDDGSFVSVWYEKMADSPMAQLRQAHWRIKD